MARRLPKGLDSLLGEDGLQISGGERQRVAIARALLRHAPVLILDEATANLDTLTERALLDAVFGALRGRSLLLISHRLVGMERMDQILVLEHGKIVERGTHDELLAACGRYQQMVETQHQLLALA